MLVACGPPDCWLLTGVAVEPGRGVAVGPEDELELELEELEELELACASAVLPVQLARNQERSVSER